MIVPKAFYNWSFEAKEAVKELTTQAAKKIQREFRAAKKTKAAEQAMEVAKKTAASKQAKVSGTKQKIHQKLAKEKKITVQTTASAPAKEEAPVNGHTPQHPRSCYSACSLDQPYGQAMHCSKSFRALVLFGVVALVTAFYQSITPPSSALTIPTGLTPRRHV